MATTRKVDIQKVRKAIEIARKSNDSQLKSMLGGLMSSNQASRSLANRIKYGK